MRNSNAAASAEDALAALPQMDISQLRRRFLVLYRKDAPTSFSRQMLTYAVAYRLQAEAFGGLKPATRRQLLVIAEQKTGEQSGDTRVRAISHLTVGTRLVREWHGVVHEVQIQEDGVLWNGQHHRSLSVVARAITNTHCSGPRFFGLHRKTGAAA